MPMTRRITMATFSVVAPLLLVGAAVAWACTPSAYISVEPARGAAGSHVTLYGLEFADGPVQIYWNSNGPLIGTTRGPEFTTGVFIPQSAATGTGYVYAVGMNRDGTVAGAARAAFVVTGANSSPPPGGGQTGGTPGRTAPSVGGSRAASPASPAVGARPGVSGGGGAAPAPAVPGAPGSGAGIAAPVGAAAPAGAAPGAVGTAAPGAAADAGVPSEAAVSGDLWSGFRSGGEAPALLGPPPPSSGSGSALGVGLIGAGLVALFAGTLVAVTRPRRSAASATPAAGGRGESPV